MNKISLKVRCLSPDHDRSPETRVKPLLCLPGADRGAEVLHTLGGGKRGKGPAEQAGKEKRLWSPNMREWGRCNNYSPMRMKGPYVKMLGDCHRAQSIHVEEM